MTDTTWERRLREDLRELADVPGPASAADRALQAARATRRRRLLVAGGGSVALAVLIAVPMITGLPGGGRLPFGAGAPAPCETATDEADPPTGVTKTGHPQFVRVVLAKLPPRDDYSLQSAHGICTFASHGPNGYAVINLGPDREQGHLTIDLSYRPTPSTCADVPPSAQIVFCHDATATTPMVVATRHDTYSFVVTAVHHDRKTVTVEAHGTPFDPEALRPVVTAPEIADLLPAG